MKIINQSSEEQDVTVDDHLKKILFNSIQERVDATPADLQQIINAIVQELDNKFIALIRR